MTIIKKYFNMLFLLGLSLIIADENFIDAKQLSLSYNKVSKSFCKNISNNKKFCKEEILSYFNYKDNNFSISLHGAKQLINKHIISYKNKNNSLLDIEDDGKGIDINWESAINIDLFSKTSLTYTVSITSSGMEGGAHPYYHLDLNNFNIATQKKLTLDDLFIKDYNKTLHEIVLAEYRDTYNFKKNQSLLEDGWYTENFILAKNFAITTKGLYFFYNPYEIKSYAEGTTELIVSYDKLQDILNPQNFQLCQEKNVSSLLKFLKK